MVGCERLGKRYGDRWLFRNFEFEVKRGECLIVVGSNGSGKSTLLKMLAGLAPPTEGRRWIEGDYRTSLGYSALDLSVYPNLTVAEHLQLSADLRGCKPNIDALLSEVELAYAANQNAKSLSTGMRARLKLALAVQAEPSTLILDEPGAGLDEAGRAALDRLVESRRERMAIVWATNETAERRYGTHEIRIGV